MEEKTRTDSLKKDKKNLVPSCASCEVELMDKICLFKAGTGGEGCPTLTRRKVLLEANREYEVPEVHEFARQASIQEAEGYGESHQRSGIVQPVKTRVVEICEFARKMGYQRLGLSFCIGLAKEAGIVNEILKVNGFQVVSICCKGGRTPKELIGVAHEEQVVPGPNDEAMCNPIYQAKLLNHEKTEFNILLGLCVGHDSLFFRYSHAPTTVLAVKDRVTGHNPLAAIYLSHVYYMKLRHPELT